MVREPLAKFTVAQDQPPPLFEQQLTADHVVGQRPRAQKKFHFPGPHQLAKQLFGGQKIFCESVSPVRFGRLLESAAHLPADRDRPRQEIDSAGLKCARGRRAQELARGRLKGFQSDVHRLELRFPRANHRTKGNKAEVLI